MNIIKGKLKTVSRTKGLILEDQPTRWFNADKQLKLEVEQINQFKGKNIELEVSDKGDYYVSIEESKEDFKNASDLKTYKKIKIFKIENTSILEEEFNKFVKDNKVTASTPLYDGKSIIMFVYYEVTE